MLSTTAQERQNWTAAGSDATAQKTYASIKAALAGVEKRRNVEVFLQGSYANATNIRADSDVDIVVMTRQMFIGSRQRLGQSTARLYDSFPRSSFSANDLKEEVLAALISYYGSARVDRRNKCIRVDGAAGYVDADVVPCVEYRWYKYSNSDLSTDFIQGVNIQPDRGGEIINFPKEHRKNGSAKNSNCRELYKPTVRQVKRLRNRARDLGVLSDGTAPGYLLECMVFNTPDVLFTSDASSRLAAVLAWLKSADKSAFKSCDEIHTLFGTDPGNFDARVGQQIINILWDVL